jgi:hypothetical protein
MAKDGALGRRKVADSKALEAWLTGKPPELAQVIALRAALRVVPLVGGPVVRVPSDSLARNLVLQTFRATFVTWTAHAKPILLEERRTAANAARDAAHHSDAAAYSAGDAAAYAAAGYAAAAAAAAADAAVSRENAVFHAVTAAGDAAYAAYVADDSDASASEILWASIAADIAWITDHDETGENVSLASGLTAERLWIGEGRGGDKDRGNFPLWARAPWNAFHAPGVWSNWYDSLLTGHTTGRFDSELEDKVEAAFISRLATQAPAFWERDAGSVNAEIARWIKEAKLVTPEAPLVPEVPGVRPAAIEPIWQDGKLTLPDILLSSDLDEASLIAALQALREDLAELAYDAKEVRNIDHRPAEYLHRLADRIPVTMPSQALLFRLGHAHEVLNDLAHITDVEWPNLLATRYRRLAFQYERSVRQFPKWRAFVRNAAERKLTTEQIAAAPQVVEIVIAELQTADAREFVDPTIPNSLLAARAPIVDWEEALSEGNEQLADDLLESINNVFKRTAEFALALKSAGIDPIASWARSTAGDSFEILGKEAKKSIVKEFGNFGKAAGPALGRFLKRMTKITTYGGAAAGGAGVLLQRLVTLYPETFGWIEPVLRFLHLG